MRRVFVPLLMLGLLATACHRAPPSWSIAAADPSTLRLTKQGPVLGGDGRYGSQAWLGIPYAKPPVGELRWRPPQPAVPWKGTWMALHQPEPCTQFASPIGQSKPGSVIGSEDCLYLNVWAPTFPPGRGPQHGDHLPVMVWIHGGGESSGSVEIYEGGHLASSQGVIVVTAQYRLGPFGWYRHAALRSQTKDPLEQSGNFGTLDLIQALRWVHENIAAFGGDPDNVTIFGESAGGLNVATLLLSPLAKGLFQRAIGESPGITDVPLYEAERFEDEQPAGHHNSSNEMLLRLLQRDRLATNRAEAKTYLAKMSDADISAYLRSQSADHLLEAYDMNPHIGMIDMPLVFHDGTVLPAGEWMDSLSSQDGWNHVPVLLGTNHDEAKLFLVFNPAFVRWHLFGIPRFVNEPKYEAVSEYITRSWKAGAIDAPASAMRRSGEQEVYAYRFDWHGEPTVWGADLSKMIGASHALEIPFVFGHFNVGPVTRYLFDSQGALERIRLSEAMMSYWTQFARTGAPGRGRDGDLLPWTAWDNSAPGAPKFIVLDTPSEGGIRMSSHVESRTRILADLESDPRLAAQVDKCRVYQQLVSWTRMLTKEQYVHAGKLGCAAYPFDDFPWLDKK